MLRHLLLAVALVLLVGVRPITAAPGDPFGDDDGGFLPPDQATGRCEDGVAKKVATLVSSITKCHIARADGKFTDATAEEACEDAAKARFVTNTSRTGCDPCTDPDTIGAQIESLLDTYSLANIYCAGSATFGGDDAGRIPPDRLIGKCEDGVAKGFSKLLGGVIKCHIARSSGKFPDEAAEDSCEATAESAFLTKTRTTRCDPCTSLQGNVTVEQVLFEPLNRYIYCAQLPPSGPDRVVFVTSTSTDGNRSGLAGADSFCQARATAAGLSGTFRAWLSTSVTAAASRLTHSPGRYVRTDGVVVANHWTDLTSGTLRAPISKDESGNNAGTLPVWTATNPNGTFVGPDCQGWTGTSDLGVTGTSSATSAQWTVTQRTFCANQGVLYCFEQ